MNLKQSLLQTIETQQRGNAEDDDGEYLQDASDTFVKEIVHVGNRDTFNKYMKGIEVAYYETINLAKSPYSNERAEAVLPDFPARAGPHSIPVNSHDGFIDMYHTLNCKRRGVTPDKNKLDLSKQQPNYGFTSHKYQGLQSETPFLDTVCDNKAQTFQQDGKKAFGSLNKAPDQYKMAQTLSKFVAGGQRPERDQMNAPDRSFLPGGSTPNNLDTLSHVSEFHHDLNNPDAQYERYKNLMTSKFYNLNVNTTPLQANSTTYDQPNYTNVIAAQKQEMLGMLKDPIHAVGNVLAQRKQPENEIKKPKTWSIYQEIPEKPKDPYPAGSYAALSMQNTVTKEVIESLGGIQDTVKQMEYSLKQREMRPYEIYRDYKSDIRALETGEHKRTNSGFSARQAEHARIMAASPFRATVKLGDVSSETDESDGDFARETHGYAKPSPIKDDSAVLRSQRDDFLTTFSQRRKSMTKSEVPPNFEGGDNLLKGIMHETHLTPQRQQTEEAVDTRNFMDHQQARQEEFTFQENDGLVPQFDAKEKMKGFRTESANLRNTHEHHLHNFASQRPAQLAS